VISLTRFGKLEVGRHVHWKNVSLSDGSSIGLL
jgi:hypothetical protein